MATILQLDTSPIDALVHQLNTAPDSLAHLPDWSDLGAPPSEQLPHCGAAALHQLMTNIYVEHFCVPTKETITAPRSNHPVDPQQTLTEMAFTLAQKAVWLEGIDDQLTDREVHHEAIHVARLILSACGADPIAVNEDAPPPPPTSIADTITAATRVILAARYLVTALREDCEATTREHLHPSRPGSS